jgi:short-subunit dehydrogenase
MQPARTVLITGPTSGIGYELGKLFARDKYDMVLVARNAKRLRELCEVWMKEYGIKAIAIVKDLSQPSAPDEIYRSLKRAKVHIDVLVNNAGFGGRGKFVERKLKDELEMIQVNVSSLTHLSGLFLPTMIARGWGRILNVASTAAFQAGPNMAVYYATKAYVLSFSEALSEEVRGTGVTVTALCPGPTRTEFQERANMKETRLFRRASVMEAHKVAEIGYRALMRGKVVEVAGMANKIMTMGVKVSPRAVPRKIVKFLHAKG